MGDGARYWGSFLGCLRVITEIKSPCGDRGFRDIGSVQLFYSQDRRIKSTGDAHWYGYGTAAFQYAGTTLVRQL